MMARISPNGGSGCAKRPLWSKELASCRKEIIASLETETTDLFPRRHRVQSPPPPSILKEIRAAGCRFIKPSQQNAQILVECTELHHFLDTQTKSKIHELHEAKNLTFMQLILKENV